MKMREQAYIKACYAYIAFIIRTWTNASSNLKNWDSRIYIEIKISNNDEITSNH